MVIPFSFIFKSPALHKYVSASSFSRSSKFLILKFMVICCKLNSVFKILSMSHMLDILCTTNVHINYDFIILKSLHSPNLYIIWANMWYPNYQNKTFNLCMLNSFKGFHLCIKWTIILWLDNQLSKNINWCMLLQALLQEYKICNNNSSMNNYIYLPR